MNSVAKLHAVAVMKDLIMKTSEGNRLQIETPTAQSRQSRDHVDKSCHFRSEVCDNFHSCDGGRSLKDAGKMLLCRKRLGTTVVLCPNIFLDTYLIRRTYHTLYRSPPLLMLAAVYAMLPSVSSRLRQNCLLNAVTNLLKHRHHQYMRSVTIASDGCIHQSPDGDSTILFLSPTSWPEPNATAAGIRTTSLLDHFSSPLSGFTSVHFGCGANPVNINKDCTVHWHQIKVNQSEQVKSSLRGIEANHGPIKAVVFDRFYAEEAYSFIVREECPNAMRILDMQDIHSLRIGRQYIVEESEHAARKKAMLTEQLMDEVMLFNPASNAQFYDVTNDSKLKQKAQETFFRELASIHRSDLVLVCSQTEMNLLEHSWNVLRSKLVPASFFCSEADLTTQTFPERTDFVTVGGFKHPPNVDSVKVLKHDIWPRIRKRLPNVNLHVYGAYPTHEIMSLRDEKSGFIVHGRVEDLDSALSKYRVLLAPLRYGAGIKGKIVDAWRLGTPVVTTPIGAEGMFSSGEDKEHTQWGGTISSNTDDFVKGAVQLYTNINAWNTAKESSALLLKKLFNGKCNLLLLENSVRDAMAHLPQRRKADIVGGMMWHHSMRSTEFFSRWIELKESRK